MSVKLNGKGRSHANSLIDSGKVDKTSSWSFSGEDGNKILGDPPNWSEYGEWFLGVDDAEGEETKAHYKYPYGKSGKVYRSGCIAAKQRAAQQGETEIENAAGAMVDRIDKKENARSWYQIKAQAQNSEIWLYDEIGLWGIGAKEFIAELNAIKSPKIDMHINSPGGEVFDGAAIYNAIKRHSAKVTTYIDGIAASIASVIALSGEKVVMAENAIYMLHNPSGMTIGTSEDMRKTADILDKVRDTMVGAYMTKSGKTQEDVIALLDAETWLDAEEAKAAGFCDEIGDEMDMAACAKFVPVMAKMGFKHIPRDLSAKKEIPSERDLDRLLRDSGCSREVAKSILARGYTEGLRDAAPPGDPAVKEPLRDAEPPKPAGKDRWTELYIRAERQVPSTA